MYRITETAVTHLARAMALLGGAVLVGLVLMTCTSITGRALVPLGLSPISGDFEMIEMGVGFAVFAFLPWCTLTRGHARVDLFKTALPGVVNRLIDLVVDAALCAAAAIIAYRLWLGMQDKQRYGETTLILETPLWWAYAAGLVGAVVFVIVAGFCVIRSLRIVVTGQDEDPAHV